MNVFGNDPSSRQAAATGLAVVGFVALIIAGMWLAIYSMRFVPAVVNRISTAAVYLGSVFVPAHEESSLSVIPLASTTISFGDTSSTDLFASSTISSSAEVDPSLVQTPEVKKEPVFTPPQTIPGNRVTSTYTLSDATTTKSDVISSPGLPDLKLTIHAVGYLATSTDPLSFVATSTVPMGKDPAVRFTIKNTGKNVAAPWCFNMTLPTQNDNDSFFRSGPQQSLKPGESIDYTPSFNYDAAKRGTGQSFLITVNVINTYCDHIINESDSTNNMASSTSITILGS